MTHPITIVDRGRGPQLSTSRITVLDVFYYLHRGYDFDVVHDVMPTLTRAEFDAIVQYITAHREGLAMQDRGAEETIACEIAEQRVKGVYFDIDESVPVEERIAQLRVRLNQRLAGTTGDRAAS